MKVLIADDEYRIRKLILDFFHKEGFVTVEAENGQIALNLFEEHGDFDLIILDVMMPMIDGWSVCREIRKKSQVPIYMLTARAENSDEIFGFDLGVDAYIKKPFSPRVLVARVRALEKKLQNRHISTEMTGPIGINRVGRYASIDDTRLELSPKEYDLLLMLVESQGQALSREQILNHVWNFDYYKGMRTIDTHIKKLRKKLQPYSHFIKTVRNFGYTFEMDADE